MSSQKAEVFHSLATLLDAGIPLSQALDTAAADHQGAIASQVRALRAAIDAGTTLSEAIEADGPGFSNFERAMIRVGETGGRLPESLRTLSQWHGFELTIRRRLLSALVLPTIVIHLAALLWPITGLITGRSSLGGYCWDVIGILDLWYISAAVVWGVQRHPGLRSAAGRALLWAPVLGRAITHLELARYCRAFQSLHGAGVGAMETAQIATFVCTNQGMVDRLRGGIASVREGNPLSDGFGPGLPPEFKAVWQSGEVSGNLDEAAQRLGQQQGERAEELFAELAQWVPRLVYGVVMVQLAGLIVSRAFLFGS